VANSLPIRILVTGGTLNDREQVESLLLIHGFSVVERPGQSGSEPGADAVVCIDSEPSTKEEFHHDYAISERSGQGTPIVLVTKPQESTGSVSAERVEGSDSNASASATPDPAVPRRETPPEVSMSKLSKLPHVITEVVEHRRASSSEGMNIAGRVVRESQRLIFIGRMAAEIAHEINNPLESIGNLLYLTQLEPGMPARALDYLGLAERELERVVLISKQTLSFSRESSEPISIQIAALMEEVVALYGRRISQKRLALVREYATVEPILALPGEIRQVLSNLVANAIEACSPGGKLRLRIRDTRRFGLEHSIHGVRITVGDNGVGIPEIARKRLGEMFFTTKGEAGTGLGLWVTNSIVARYGGVMKFRSSHGERHGTTFTVFLPAAKGEQATAPGNRNHSSGNVTEISRHPLHSTHQSGTSGQARFDIPLEDLTG
jgi:two-component system, NtrC family, sensor kinase